MKTFFLEIIPKEDLLKCSHKKFGEIRAKILRTPKNLPAPTPMVGGTLIRRRGYPAGSTQVTDRLHELGVISSVE